VLLLVQKTKLQKHFKIIKFWNLKHLPKVGMLMKVPLQKHYKIQKSKLLFRVYYQDSIVSVSKKAPCLFMG